MNERVSVKRHIVPDVVKRLGQLYLMCDDALGPEDVKVPSI